MSDLSFVDQWDIARFKKKCVDQRRIAEQWPAYDRNMALVDEYRWRLGPWALSFMLEVWAEPVWHGSAAILETIGYTTVDPKWRTEIPQDALLSINSWVPEHFEQARFILAEIFGPILKPGDQHQPALETKGVMALHWHVKYEGNRPWRKYQS